MCIVHYVLEMSLINSLVIWRRVLQVNSTHLGYREALIEGLVGRASHATASQNSPKVKRRRLSGDSLPSQSSSTTRILFTNWKGSQKIVCGAGPQPRSSPRQCLSAEIAVLFCMP